jgi:hypothetical protein
MALALDGDIFQDAWLILPASTMSRLSAGKPNPYKGAASECRGAASCTGLRQSCG